MHSKIIFRVFAWLTLWVFVTPSFAQGSLEEVVVTGSRMSVFERDTLPVVHLKRRADFLVATAYIESDSRDAKLRRKEVMSTIDAVVQMAAKNKTIVLGLLRELEVNGEDLEYVVPFSKQAILDAGLGSGYRPDTTRVSLIVKTPITASDESPDKVVERLEDFIDEVPGSGRAAASIDGDVGLSIVDISQYRESLLRKIAEDIKNVRSILGDDYRISVTGLEEPVRWRVTGGLTLALYFPYMSSAHINN